MRSIITADCLACANEATASDQSYIYVHYGTSEQVQFEFGMDGLLCAFSKEDHLCVCLHVQGRHVI